MKEIELIQLYFTSAIAIIQNFGGITNDLVEILLQAMKN